ncbi:hypothetical protein [Terricaulis silvestris]|uniref:Uncharacterized protein n=1 Tax=Terricaulis silvestris TaxID=2686094 RepID=A0A6I6MN00_9CAUL|nr:hypothetical protein [Terricaulis silvestris]QGZ94748.1 hypothetical protein DSM104635_01578 [Terricaulis silvestris]
MADDLVRLLSYMLASTVVLAVVIVFVGGLRGGRAPGWPAAPGVALLISVVGILFGKYGENFDLPWWIYYTVPMLATVLIPPLAFRFNLWRAALYVLLAVATAPLIHAAFFYALGWGDFMPFLALPAL